MALFRFHRGSLADSLSTMETVNNINHLKEIISAQSSFPIKGDLKIKFYCHDPRCDWDIYLVSDDNGIIGMLDTELK